MWWDMLLVKDIQRGEKNMNVGQLRFLTRDVDPDTEVMLKIELGNVKEDGSVYADATTIDYSDVEKHQILYIEANEY